MSAAMLRRIAGLLVAAVVLWVLVSVWRRGERDDPGLLQLPGLDTARVDRVALSRAADSIVAVRQSGAWKVNGFPASAEYVSRFLAAYADSARRTELVARSRASHSRLGVDSAAGRRLTIDAGGSRVVDLVLGNRGPDLEGVYLRAAADSAVYLLRGALPDLLLDALDVWRDRRILSIAADSVTSVRVGVGRASWELTRQGSMWQVNGGAADSVKVRRYLTQFANLRASGFPDPATPVSGFERPARTVAISTASGAPRGQLEFVEGEGGSYWVRVTGSETVYRLPMATVDLLAPARPDLSP